MKLGDLIYQAEKINTMIENQKKNLLQWAVKGDFNMAQEELDKLKALEKMLWQFKSVEIEIIKDEADIISLFITK